MPPRREKGRRGDPHRIVAPPFYRTQPYPTGRRDRLLGGDHLGRGDDQILAAQRELASRDGVFVEPASAAGVAGLLQRLAAGESYAGSTVVVTVTGHGLKDPTTAMSQAESVVTCEPDLDQVESAVMG